MTLTEFLLARIAEDKAAALSALPRGGRRTGKTFLRRALAECEAKRLIVQYHGSEILETCQEGCPGLFPCRTLVALCLPYADHPDYPVDLNTPRRDAGEPLTSPVA